MDVSSDFVTTCSRRDDNDKRLKSVKVAFLDTLHGIEIATKIALDGSVNLL